MFHCMRDLRDMLNTNGGKNNEVENAFSNKKPIDILFCTMIIVINMNISS